MVLDLILMTRTIDPKRRSSLPRRMVKASGNLVNNFKYVYSCFSYSNFVALRSMLSHFQHELKLVMKCWCHEYCQIHEYLARPKTFQMQFTRSKSATDALHGVIQLILLDIVIRICFGDPRYKQLRLAIMPPTTGILMIALVQASPAEIL